MRTRHTHGYAGRERMVGAELITGTIEALEDSASRALGTAAGWEYFRRRRFSWAATRRADL